MVSLTVSWFCCFEYGCCHINPGDHSFVVRWESEKHEETQDSRASWSRTTRLAMVVWIRCPHSVRPLTTWFPVGDAIHRGTMSLEVGFGSWRPCFPCSCSLLHACSQGCEIPATSCSSHHACCLLPCLPIMTDPYPSGTISLNKILSSTSCSGRGSTGRSTHCFCGGPWSSGLSTHAGWLTTPVTPASGDPLASSHP